MKQLIIPVLLAFGLWGCSSSQLVHTDLNRSADFSAYRSFKIADDFKQGDGAKPENFNDLAMGRLTSAMVSEMKGRGYQLEEQYPDLLLTFHLRVDRELNYRTTPSAWNPWGTVNSYYDTNGTLVVNLIDQDTKKLVWQGYTTVDWQRSPEKRDKKLREAVSLIFTKYPYRVGGRPVN